MPLDLETKVADLYRHKVAALSQFMSRKLAAAVAAYSDSTDADAATVEDLLNYFPSRYEDRSNFLKIDQLYDGIEASVELFVRVSGGYQVRRKGGARTSQLYIFEISAGDRERQKKPVVVLWFISGKAAKQTIEYYSKRFERNARFVAHGKWEWDGRRNTFVLKVNKPEELEILPPDEVTEPEETIQADEPEPAPDASPKKQDEDEPDDPAFAFVHNARRVPVYRKLGNFQTKRLREIVFDLLAKLDPKQVGETLPSEIVSRNKLIGRAQAVSEIHFPPENSSIADYEMFRSPAQIRLIFEEFFWLSFALQLKRGERKREPKRAVIEIPKSTLDRMKAMLPFDLTDAQRRVLKQIFADLTSKYPMNRLVQGDVGSGKTIVAFLAMFAAMENGYQTALMAPTEILAEQHFRNAERTFADAGYKAGLLTGGMKAAEKRKMQSMIASGEVQLVIGTHALIQDDVKFESIGLAVIDEQHRFGVLQRAELRAHGIDPDVLVMTATPIPRSLAMTVYGDLDVSIVDELPPGRTPVKTVVLGEDKRPGVYKGIEREILKGRQIYIVYPLIEESEKLDLRAATEMYEELRTKVFPNRSIGLLHGRSKPADKNSIMEAFGCGKLDILVSTTVIEVGVDVPNATLMVIEHAERFGLSQLHQLRGRVGRGANDSYCVLMTGDKKTAVAKERLGIMEETNDGFKIAEKDLEIRGQGEIFGTRQSGVQLFKIANIIRDLEILEAAKLAAETALTRDRGSKETAAMIESVTQNNKFKLAGIG